MRDRRVTLALVGVCVVALLTGGQSAVTATTPDDPDPAASPYRIEGGLTSPIFSYRNAIRESVWVLAPDFDHNGRPDRVTADIIRPAELDGTPIDVPVIMHASPYFGCCYPRKFDENGNLIRFPYFYDNYFMPRGYAFVSVDMAGTNRSTGCADEGAGSDIGSVKAVVDWLNGRGRAVDARGRPAEADWTNGRVGMIGLSYDGTLANGVAATGVEGLETIVPQGAISSWYDYTRYGGLITSFDYATWLSRLVASNRTTKVDCKAVYRRMARRDGDKTGAYNAFWLHRDYREVPTPDASKVTASVFVVHGLQDYNVKTPHFARWWSALRDNGVETKLWLSRLGHYDPFDHDRARWVDTLHRWFDHELWGIPNGITDEPAVSVETSPRRWVNADDWPVADRTVVLSPRSRHRLVHRTPEPGRAIFRNIPYGSEGAMVTIGPNRHRLLYATRRLAQPIRVSGTPRVHLSVRHQARTGQVAVALVDYGRAKRVLGLNNLATKSCWGESTKTDSACFRDQRRWMRSTPLQVIARGWARLDGPGQHTVDVDLTTNDVTVPAGHRLGLVVYGSSSWYEPVDFTNTRYTVRRGGSWLRLPILGALQFTGPSTLASLPTEIPDAAVHEPDRRRRPYVSP
jgi:X-Pro dipeptidyl-peptidase